MVTTLKDTAKPVTDLPFPAVTICASGLHMDNVQRKLKDNFLRWRVENQKIGNTMEAMKEDMKEYMHKSFQINLEEASTSETKPANILDILDTMIAPNVEASVAANGVRDNILACKETGRRKKRSTCTCSCPDTQFKRSGKKCFGVSKHSLTNSEAVTQCSKRGAVLATIANAEDDNFVGSLMPGSYEYGYWIGLNDSQEERAFVWQDGSPLSYNNWAQSRPKLDSEKNCVVKSAIEEVEKKWWDQDCNLDRRFVCSQPAENSCGSNADCPTQIISSSNSGILTELLAETTTTTASACVHSCSNSAFRLSGTNCFWASSTMLNYTDSKSQCCSLGAQLATVDSDADREAVKDMMESNEGNWIGLNNLGGSGWVWQDGSTPTTPNWKNNNPNEDAEKNCVTMRTSKKWDNTYCFRKKYFLCSMPSLNPCDKEPRASYPGCDTTTSTTTTTIKRSQCTCSCPNSKFKLTGSNCFMVSETSLSFTEAIPACVQQGAKLATITSLGEDNFVNDLMTPIDVYNLSYWIGLNDIEDEGTFVWQDGSPPSSYTNWSPTGHNDVNGAKDCTSKRKDSIFWYAMKCHLERRFVCSQPAVNSCGSGDCPTETTFTTTSTTTTTIATTSTTTDTSTQTAAADAFDEMALSAVKDMMNQQECIKPSIVHSSKSETTSSPKLPSVDVFLNPTKKEYMKDIVKEKKEIAQDYFNSADMQSLYPELFSLLWESTLPCYNSLENDNMLLSCQLAGSEVNCSDLFTKVPTDTGMCCALNNLDSLRNSKYKEMVKKLQGNTPLKKLADARVGQRNGLRLTLDLHSNTVSFGTLDQEYEGFSVFIGHPAEFPMMKEKSIKVEPGREHFIDLSATMVSANDIKAIAPEDRHCFFQDESDLDFYKRYTFSNCRLECAIETLEKIFKCVPWHLPRVRNSLHFRN